MNQLKEEKPLENKSITSPNSQVSAEKEQASGDQKSTEIVLSKKTYNQKWPSEQEEIFANWADIAACYRLLHDWSQKRYYRLNLMLSIPVILLTTLTGSANLSVSSVSGNDPNDQKIPNLIIGGISIIAGILSTISNFLRYAPNMEAHRIAALAWGKLQRAISVELALDRNDRKDSMDYLKLCRAEVDRLIEQSPSVPESILKRFELQFKEPVQKKLEGQAVIKKPEICNYLEHTYIYRPPGKIDESTNTESTDDTRSEVGFHSPPPLKEATLKNVQEYIQVARALNQQQPEVVVDKEETKPAPKNELAEKIEKLARTTKMLEDQQKAAKQQQNAILYPQTDPTHGGPMYYLG